MRRQRTVMPTNLRRQRGIAIALIVTAVALAVLIGVALTFAGRAGAEVDDSAHNRILATVIIQQGETLNSAIYAAVIKDGGQNYPVNLDTGAVDHTTGGVGVYNPYDGITEPQTPPKDAFTGSAGNWLMGQIKANGLGTGKANSLVIGLDNLTLGVCQQINKLLTNAAAIPSVGVAVTMSGNYDFTSYAAMNGYYSICFMDSNNTYHYFTTGHPG